MKNLNPVLPSVYQETLTYGETLGVVAEKVNECVDAVNANDKKVDDLTNLVGTFDSRITTNTEDIASNIESINSLNYRIGSLEEELPQFESIFSTRIAEQNKKITALETRTDDIVSNVNTLTQDVLDNTSAIGTLQADVNANTAAIAKSKEKMTLLSDITLSQDTAGLIELIRDTRISTFYIETSIPQVAENTTGQIFCDYTEAGQNITLSTLFARSTAITNITINAMVTGGFHLFLATQHNASSPRVLGTTQAAIYMDNTIITKIRFRLLNNVSIPAGSTFKVYGILED